MFPERSRNARRLGASAAHVLSDTTLVVCAVAYGGAVMVWGTRVFAKEWEVTFGEALFHLLRKRRP
jgi:hypothetical protein